MSGNSHDGDNLLWATAVHEAGHAVARHLLGVGFRRVSIVPDEESEGRIECWPWSQEFWTAVEEADHEASYGGFLNGRTRRAVEKQVMSLLAGGFAAMNLTGMEDHDVGMGITRLTDDEVEDLRAKHGGMWDKLVTTGDYQNALSLAIKVSGSDEEGTAYLAWLEARTHNLVRAPGFCSAVGALARELLGHGVLSGRRARAVIQEVLAMGPPGGVAVRDLWAR
jgi:hypothetical protein